MDIGGYLSQGMKRMGGGDWASAHCLEKIQEMLSRAIKDQEDLWNMLLASTTSAEFQPGSSDLGVEGGYGEGSGQTGDRHLDTFASELIPARNLRPLTVKVENSLDWCHLALCRIKELTVQSPRSTQPIIKQQATMLRYPKLDHKREPNLVLLHPRNSKPNLHGPNLTPLQIPARDVDVKDASLLLPDETPIFPPDSMNHFINRPQGTSSTTLAAPPVDQVAGQPDQPTLSMLASDLEPRQGQNFEGLIPARATGMDTAEWPNFQDEYSEAMDDVVPCEDKDQLLITASPVTSKEGHHHHHPGDLSRATGRNHLKMGAAAAAATEDHNFPQENNGDELTEGEFMYNDEICGRAMMSRHIRNNSIPAKRDRDNMMSIGTHEKSMVVTYQRLRPGVDNKRGIPVDGHRGWKKYGSKSIQNANFSRGYYKCSVKECNAKKSVQPTDKDPSVFQVTYTGTHTCSNTYTRRKTHRITSVQPAAAAAPSPQVIFGKAQEYHESPAPKPTAPSHDQAVSAATCQKLEPKRSPAVPSMNDEKDGVGPETQEKLDTSVVHLPGLSTEAAGVVKQKVVNQARSFTSLSELATAASGQYAADQLTSSDLESLTESLSSDSSMPQAAAGHEDWNVRYALIDQGDQEGLNNVDNIDSCYTLSNVQTSNSSTGGIANESTQAAGYHDLHFVNQLLNYTQDFNSQESMLQEWRELIMGDTLFSTLADQHIL